MNIFQKLIERIPNPYETQTETEQSPHSILSTRDVVPLTLGLCEDGLPVRIDLNDPELQPIALISDNAQDNTLLFGHILGDLLSEHNADDVQFALLKRRESHWQEQLAAAEERGLMLSLDSINPRREWEFLYQAAEIAEQRHNGDEDIHPPLLILIEDLAVLAHSSSDFRLNFEWLCLYGPPVGLHLMAALTTQDALQLGRWLRYFPVRMLGPLSPAHGERFGLHGALPASPRSGRFTRSQGNSEGSGTTFAVWSTTEWLYFRLNPQEAHNQKVHESRTGEIE